MDEDSKSMDPDRNDRFEKLGYVPQKEIIYNKLLPYSDKLDEESCKMLIEIKGNLGNAVLMREIKPACRLWVARLYKYIKMFGLKFSKEDHISFIHLMYELVIIPNLEPRLLNNFAQVLLQLLRKKELLSPKELTLPWRPLYDLCKRITCSRGAIGMYRYLSSLENSLDSLIRAARFYFPVEATQEMLHIWRPKLCPFDSATMLNTFDMMECFLPVALPPELNFRGYKLWFKEFMTLWDVCHNVPNWECEMMWLMARLANYNIGFIDWEPYIPLMFTRFLRTFHLPVTYKNVQQSRTYKIDTSAMALWIVSVMGGGSSAQIFLDKLMKTLESYFHPANYGCWILKLKDFLRRLPIYFAQRLHRERYKKHTWETPVPESHKLTEEDITKFVESLKSVALQAMFTKTGHVEVTQTMQHLANLRPNIIIPHIIDRLYANLETLTEPNKLTAAMLCTIAVARSMVQGIHSGYKEGPTHVIPLMIASLPGIDPNDMKKCLMTFQLIATFSTMVPIVDSSKASSYWNNLTEEEEIICIATAGFEDFVLQFMDRSFMLIESSSLENTRLDRDSDKMSKLENMAESALSSSFTSLLMQTSTEIFKSALRKMHLFVTTRILETKVAGQFVAVVVRSFVKVNPEETLKTFLPHLCSAILSLTESEDVIKEDALDEELIYNLLILSQLVDCIGTALLPYIIKLEQVLDRTLHLRSRRGYLLATKILSNILVGLSSTTVLEYRSTPKSLDQDVKDFLPIKDWGKPGNIFNLQVKWHTPSTEEVLCAQNLVRKYLLPELDRIKKYVSNEVDMSREELQCSLNVIIATFGCFPLLPMENENPAKLIDRSVPLISTNTIDFSYFGTVTMPDGSNIRKAVAETINALQTKLLECKEDDTKSLFYVISIWECILMKNSLNGKYDYRSKNFRMAKKLFEDKVTGQKRHLRQLLVDRVMLQHELLQEKSVMIFTETHQMILLNLLNLSTSHYSEVRSRAQAKLFSAMETFSYSFLTLVPNLVQYLKLDSNTNHEQFKGALFVLLGPKQKPLIARNNWDVLLSLWPSIIGSKPTEKLSVIRLLENIVDCIHKHFSTTMINLEVPDSCINRAHKLWNNAPIPQKDMVSPDDINAGLKQLEMKSKGNLEKYHSLLNLLMDAIETGNLHWRYHGMALNFLRDLVHPDVPYPARIVKFFLHTLIHDSIEARKIAIRSTVFLLKQQKRSHKKIKINPLSFGDDPSHNKALVPGERSDTRWIKYNKDTIPLTPEEWDKGRYIHNAYSGYYCWPEDQEVYAPSSEQPSLDRRFEDLNDEEKEVYSFFTNQQNVDKLIQYLSLEDKKGKDKFNGYTFMMFKGLFRNHADVALKCFISHLLHLVGDKQESSQRCAAEIIAGVIRGSKHWPFEKILNLWTFLTPVIETALSNMTVESVADWGVCFATASENRDPNRHHWLLELLMKDPLRDEASFIECGRLYALQGALVQQQWRVSELFNRLLNYLKPFLTHPFQNVRERLGSVITNILAADILFPNGSRTESPHISDFINDALPQLKILYDLCTQSTSLKADDVQNGKVKDNLTKKLNEVTITLNEVEIVQELNAEKVENSLRLLKTVCRWISGSLLRAQYAAVTEYFKIFPLICLMESYDADEEVVKSCKNLLGTLGQSISLPEHIPYALKAVMEVSNSLSWQARLTSLEFLQVFVFHNMPSILSNLSWIKQVSKIVLRLLEDEWLDVRIKASQVLSGLLHCDFVDDTQELMDTFKLKSQTKIYKRNKSNSTDSKMLEALRLRHSGVLGMCAFVNAYPYDVPEFVPGVFLKLGEHLNDPEPIPSTIRKTLGDFKRTHHDNWQQHCLKFTEEELAVLGDLTIPPSYYA